MTFNIPVILGSVRRDRIGLGVALYAAGALRERGRDVTLIDPLEHPLPLLITPSGAFESPRPFPGGVLLQTVGDRPGKAGDRFFDELEWYARSLRMARSLGTPY